ncbi:uncharacterized protein [Patagioenas fasciata]|uniref:uncharacterized protein n=1 Tax=Patagioenas fasciata TaxID=372321 RepID=UPI003A9938C8
MSRRLRGRAGGPGLRPRWPGPGGRRVAPGRSPCCPRAVAVLPPGGSGGVPLVAPAVPRLKILLTPRWDRDRRQFRPGYPRPRDHKDTLVTCGQPDVTQNSQVLLAELLSSGSTPKPCCLLALVLSTPISPGFLQLLCPLDPSYRFCSDGEHLTVLCMAKMMRTLDRKSLPSAAFLSPLGSDNSPGIATAAPTAPVSRQQHQQPRYRDSSTDSPGIATGSSDGAGIAMAALTALIL